MTSQEGLHAATSHFDIKLRTPRRLRASGIPRGDGKLRKRIKRFVYEWVRPCLFQFGSLGGSNEADFADYSDGESGQRCHLRS